MPHLSRRPLPRVKSEQLAATIGTQDHLAYSMAIGVCLSLGEIRLERAISRVTYHLRPEMH